jgi:hypothetical protein
VSFLNSLGKAAEKIQNNGFAKDIGLPTLMFDIASVATNDKGWVGDAFNIAASTFRTGVLAASLPIRKTAGFAFDKVLMPTAMLSYETGGRYLREPLSAAFLTAATGDVKKSWENRDEISAGQALAYLGDRLTFGAAPFIPQDFDIFNENDRKMFQEDWTLRTLTGAYDTFFTTVTDPLGKLGKGIGLAKKALVTRPLGATDANMASLTRDFFIPKSIRSTTILSPQTLKSTINAGKEEGGEIYNTLSWFAKSDRIAVRAHPMIAASNDGDTLSYLLGEAKSVDEVADTLLAVTAGDTEAMGRLVANRKQMSFVFDKLKSTPRTQKQVLDNIPTNGIVDDANVLAAADDLLATLGEDPYFKMLSSFDDRAADLSKRTFGTPVFEKMAINRAERRAAKLKDFDRPTSYPTVGYFQPTKYHPLVAVVNFGVKKVGDGFAEKPSGYINLNDSDSFNEIAAFGTLLRRLVGNGARETVERNLEQYIQAGGTPELRARVVESFEDEAISLINRKLGISDEAGAAIWSAYKSRRTTARQSIKDRKFLMTDDDVILKIPYLERQGANALPMADLENYARVVEKNKSFVNSIAGGLDVTDPDSWRYTTGIINDMWKASVLLRLGYTIRNTSEAALSILAKGYGLMALGDLNKEGAAAWYSNRVVGLERLADKRMVAQGLREDSVQLRQAFSQEQMQFMASERVFEEVKDYLPAVERLFRQGKLSEAQYSEMLDVFEYATGEWLYHGSAMPLKGLDNSRAFAMTYSEDIANRYAESGMPIVTASSIYQKLTGKAYQMPKNLRSAETGKLLKGPKREPSLAMQTIASDMREGFQRSIDNGNNVEMLNPQTGQWKAINPETVSQDKLLTAQFRVRKPGNQGVVMGQKVYGKTIDLQMASGNQARLGLKDYPELKKILEIDNAKKWRGRSGWEGKEDKLLNWMRANGVGKLVLPDNKSNGLKTILVDPDMVEAFGKKPVVTLAQKRLDAVKKQKEFLSEEPRIASIIERTMEQGGGTFKFADSMDGDVPTQGVSVAVRGATHSFSLDSAQTNPQAWIDSMAAHFEKNLEKFGSADHFGTWVEDIDGVPHIWAEPVNVVKDRNKAILLGQERNQKGIFDIGKGEFISTGGTGDEGASAAFALGQGTKANFGYVSRGEEAVRAGARGAGATKRVDELAAAIASKQYPLDGIVNIVRELADTQALHRKNMQGIMTKLNARIVEESRLTGPKAIQGTGRRTITLYDGTKIEIDDAFAGELGQILLDRTDNTSTYRNFVDHPAQLFTAQYGGFVEEVLTPNMPQYYTGYSNSLSSFFRSPDGRIDPLIEMFLDGSKPEDVVKWLRKPENKSYAQRFNIDAPGIKVASERLNTFIDAEDFVGDLHSAYNRYLPDAEIQEAFRAGIVDEQWLRRHFADETVMPDIVGRIVPTSPQARNWQDAMAKVVDRAFYFLGTLPETALARHPMARQFYRTEMKQRLNTALATKRISDPKAELTINEINALRTQAIEGTRKEVNKTLFTIIRKSYAGEKMRFIMPFFNAWENTIRRWGGLASDNPAVIARAGQVISSLRNQPNIVDRDGNPTNEFSYDNKIIVPMSEGAISAVSKIPVWGKGMAEALKASGTEVKIPVRSLDILFQGEATAGFGPVVTMPVNEIVKLKPDLEDIVTTSVLPVLPFGPQEKSIQQLFPPAAQKLVSLIGQDEAWSRTFNTVYRYELIRFNLGDRSTLPTLEEVRDMSNNMYRVKMLSNLVMPFAAQYDSPLSFYTQQFRKLQQTYGADAEALFLQMYPEMGPALVSASYNPTGAQASQKAYKNIQKYSSLISKVGQQTPEMIGFLVNDPDGKYDFSEAVYAWQYGNAPVPGSTENYRGRRNPAELKKDANVKVGWIEFRKKMNLLDSQLYAQGYQSYSESGAEELNMLRQLMVSDITTRNRDWAADYYSVDRGKWIYRMESLKTMLSDRKWMEDNSKRPVVSSIAVYLNTRTQIARELSNRKAYGGASTLTAKENEDLDAYWNSVIYQLKTGSPEFEEFFNRFLQNDPVTLG